MLFPRLVVFRRAPHQALGQLVAVQGPVGFPGSDLFDQVQQRAAVAIGHVQQRLARRTRQGQRAAQVLLGALRQTL